LQSDLEVLSEQLNAFALASSGEDGITQPNETVQDVLTRLEAIEAALAERAAAEEAAEADPVEAPDLTEEIAALRAELEAIKAVQDAAPLTVEAEDGTDAAAAALALSAIESAARRGRPFLSAHQQLQAALPGISAVDTLGPLSISGAPTLSDLRVRFTPLKREALDTEAREVGEGSSWMRSIFGDGVKVRRSGEQNAVDVLDDAEAALAEGDLSRAIRNVERLSEPVQGVFTDWLDSARKRESLEAALESLRLTMIAENRP